VTVDGKHGVIDVHAEAWPFGGGFGLVVRLVLRDLSIQVMRCIQDQTLQLPD